MIGERNTVAIELNIPDIIMCVISSIVLVVIGCLVLAIFIAVGIVAHIPITLPYTTLTIQ